MNTTGRKLSRILSQLAAGAGEQALDGLLAHWSSQRDPRVGQAIALLGRRLVEVSAVDVSVRGMQTQQFIKLAREAEAASLTAVLDAMVLRPKELEVFEILAQLPPDPRIADCALEQLSCSESIPQSRRLIRCIERHGGPEHGRALARLGPLIAGARALLSRIDHVVAKLDRTAWHLPNAVLNQLLDAVRAAPLAANTSAPARWREPLRERLPTEAELLAMIYQTPRDDALRWVYGDMLSERGDPRGEFIHLQHRQAEGTLTTRQETRMRAIEREQQRLWLAPILVGLDPKSLVFERGFLAEARTVPDVPNTLWERPEWGTVRRLRGELTLRHVWHALEHLETSSESMLSATKDCVLPLQSLDLAEDGRTLRGRLPQMPALTTLTLRGHTLPKMGLSTCLAALCKRPFARQLSLVTLPEAYFGHWSHWSFDVADACPFETLLIGLSPKDRMELRKGPSGRYEHITFHVGSRLSPPIANSWERLLASFRLHSVPHILFLRNNEHYPASELGRLVQMARGCGDSITTDLMR